MLNSYFNVDSKLIISLNNKQQCIKYVIYTKIHEYDVLINTSGYFNGCNHQRNIVILIKFFEYYYYAATVLVNLYRLKLLLL